MTIMTRSKYSVQIREDNNDVKHEATNHGKRWTEAEDKMLEDLHNTPIITHGNIQLFARSVNRTYGAIKSRMLSTYAGVNFDYENYDNNKALFNKFKFATEEDIEYYALKKFNKRDRKLFKLNKLESIITKYANKINENDFNRLNDTLESLKDGI